MEGERRRKDCPEGLEEYERAGTFEGYEVFVSYDREGPDREEAMALYQEAKNSIRFQSLAAMEGREME